jgi:hypothetical protein
MAVKIRKIEFRIGLIGLMGLIGLSFSVFSWPSKDSVQSTGFSRQYWGSKPSRLKPVL